MAGKKLIIAGVISITLASAASLYAFASPNTKKENKTAATTTEAATKSTTEITTEQTKKTEVIHGTKKEGDETKEEAEDSSEDVLPDESTEGTDKDEFGNPDEYEDDSLEKCNHDWDTSIAYDSEKGYVWEKTCKKCHSVVTEPATQEEYEKYEPQYDDSDSEYVDDGSAETVEESTEEVLNEELK